jgi:SAM-dependent methyltransferase
VTSDHASTSSYRSEFNKGQLAKLYDASEYGPRSWSTLLWQVEKKALGKLLDSRSFVPNRERYLDFACGTGRITAFVAPHFEQTVGVDINEAMLEEARPRTPGATFVKADVVADPEAAGGDFDFITAFRFILNADPADRLPALRWMRSRMRDDTSRAVVNNHSNLWSHKAVTHGLRQLRARGRRTTGNVLSHRDMSRLVTEAGFTIESVHGMGFGGGQALRLIPFEHMARYQQALSGVPGLERLGEDQLYVLAPN